MAGQTPKTYPYRGIRIDPHQLTLGSERYDGGAIPPEGTRTNLTDGSATWGESWPARAGRAEEQVRQLRAALQRYGDHSEYCSPEPRACNCGLADALKIGAEVTK